MIDTNDPRIVYGARCVWWDSIEHVGALPGSGFPCCPYCSGVLFEMDTEAQWWEAIDRYAAQADEPGYRAMWEWSRGRCFPTMNDLRAAYAARPAKNGATH